MKLALTLCGLCGWQSPAAPVAPAANLSRPGIGLSRSSQVPTAVATPATPQTPARASQDWLARQVSNVLMYLHCDDLAGFGTGLKKTALARLFDDPEVKECVREGSDLSNALSNGFLEQVRQRVEEENPEIPKEVLDAVFSAARGLNGHLSVAFRAPHAPSAHEAESEGEMFASAGFTGTPEELEQGLRKLAESLRKQFGDHTARRVALDGQSYFEFGGSDVPDGDDPSVIRVARRGSQVFMAMPSALSMGALLGPAEAAPLAGSPAYQEARALLGGRPDAAWAFIDGPALLSTMDTETIETGMRSLGLEKLRWAGLSSEPEGELVRHRLEVRTEPAEGMLALFTAKEPKKFTLASVLPKRTLMTLQMALDGVASFEALKKLVSQFGDVNEPSFDTQMADMRKQLGSSFADVAPLLGDEAAVAVAMPEAGVIPDVYLLVRAKDAASAQDLMARSEIAMRRVAAKDRKGQLRDIQEKSTRIVYMRGQGAMTPSLLVSEDLLVVSSSVQAARRYLSFRAEPASERLSDRADYTQTVASVATGPTTGVLWLDVPRLVSFTYGNLAEIAAFLGPQLSDMGELEEESEVPGVDGEPAEGAGAPSRPGTDSRRQVSVVGLSVESFDFNRLPQVETVLKYMRPQAVRVTLSREGISMESRAIF